METKIVKEPVEREELRALAHEQYGDSTKSISRERWFTLPLADQLGNVGSEVGRARTWQGRDEKLFWGAAGRALELLDLTREDARWRARRSELDRARESVADAILGGAMYGSHFPALEDYFTRFALYAQGTRVP